VKNVTTVENPEGTDA